MTFLVSIDDWNRILQFFIVIKDAVILFWLAYWAWRFWRSLRQGGNGITTALILFFGMMAVERLWLVANGLYHLFWPEMSVATFVLLSWRESGQWLVIASMIFVTWRFTDNAEHH